MEFATNHALGKTWRQYHYMNHAWRLGHEDDMVIYCSHLDQAKIMWEAYKHFFEVKGEPIFREENFERLDQGRGEVAGQGKTYATEKASQAGGFCRTRAANPRAQLRSLSL